MSMEGYISIAAIVIAVVLAGIVLFQHQQATGQPITLADAGEILHEAQPLVADVKTELEMIVLGVDQLMNNGHINTDQEAFQKAFAVARKRWPDIDPEALTVFIEGIYNVTLGRNKPVPAPAAPPPPKSEGELLGDIAATQLLGGKP